MDWRENRRSIRACRGQHRTSRGRCTMLQGLGYAGFGSDKLDDWRQFGTSLVGLQAVERGPQLLAFRMDDRTQRIVIDRSMADGARFFGWEVADGTALDALAAKLEAAHVDVTAGPPAIGWKRFTAPRSMTRRFVPDARFPASAPARSGLDTPC